MFFKKREHLHRECHGTQLVGNTKCRENDRSKTISVTFEARLCVYSSDTWSGDSAPSTTLRAVTLY